MAFAELNVACRSMSKRCSVERTSIGSAAVLRARSKCVVLPLLLLVLRPIGGVALAAEVTLLPGAVSEVGTVWFDD